MHSDRFGFNATSMTIFGTTEIYKALQVIALDCFIILSQVKCKKSLMFQTRRQGSYGASLLICLRWPPSLSFFLSFRLGVRAYFCAVTKVLALVEIPTVGPNNSHQIGGRHKKGCRCSFFLFTPTTVIALMMTFTWSCQSSNSYHTVA